VKGVIKLPLFSTISIINIAINHIPGHFQGVLWFLDLYVKNDGLCIAKPIYNAAFI
jgi:hypothetical protein